jgi:hypothetical protein
MNSRKIQIIAAYLIALLLTGFVTLKAEQPGVIQGNATVRTVSGKAVYSVGGAWMPLKVNMELASGTTIHTDPDSYVYLSVNGLSSAVRLAGSTTVTVQDMDRIGSAREGDTKTMLAIKTGSILGQVKKLSASSTYEIKTPHGVAGIRGTDFGIVVYEDANGNPVVTFTSVSGQVIVSAIVNGQIETVTLATGQSWTPGDSAGVQLAPQTILATDADVINQMIISINNQINNPTGNAPPNLTPTVGTVLPPFTTSGPPSGTPSPPNAPVFNSSPSSGASSQNSSASANTSSSQANPNPG